MNAIEQFNLKFGFQFDSATSCPDTVRLMAEHAELLGRHEIARLLLEKAEVLSAERRRVAEHAENDAVAIAERDHNKFPNGRWT